MTAGALYAPSAIGRRPGGQTDLRLHLSLSMPLRPEHMILSLRLALSLALPLRTAGRIYSFCRMTPAGTDQRMSKRGPDASLDR